MRNNPTLTNEVNNKALEGFLGDLISRFGNIPVSPDNARIPLRADQTYPSLSSQGDVRQSRWSNSSPATIVNSAIAVADVTKAHLGTYEYSYRSAHTSSTASTSVSSPAESSPRTPKRVASFECPTEASSRWSGRSDVALPAPPLRRDTVRIDRPLERDATTTNTLASSSSGSRNGEEEGSQGEKSLIRWGEERGGKNSDSQSPADLIKPPRRRQRLVDSLRKPPY
jgi:hypothetical protein